MGEKALKWQKIVKLPITHVHIGSGSLFGVMKLIKRKKLAILRPDLDSPYNFA